METRETREGGAGRERGAERERERQRGKKDGKSKSKSGGLLRNRRMNN
jgi:hypothetical protein